MKPETRRVFLSRVSRWFGGLTLMAWSGGWLSALTGCPKQDHGPLPPLGGSVDTQGQTLTVYQATSRSGYQLASESYVGVSGRKITVVNGYASPTLIFLVNNQPRYGDGASGSVSADTIILKAGDRLTWYDLATGQALLDLQLG